MNKIAARWLSKAVAQFFFEIQKAVVAKRDRKLPAILTREQVNMLIDSMDNYKHKAITATMYSSGLRVSKVCHLRYEDIRRKQRMIHVPLSIMCSVIMCSVIMCSGSIKRILDFFHLILRILIYTFDSLNTMSR